MVYENQSAVLWARTRACDHERRSVLPLTDNLVAFAGVHAAEKSSGKKGADPETSWHMAKTGSPYLRAALFRIAVVGLQHKPIVGAHYARESAQAKRR